MVSKRSQARESRASAGFAPGDPVRVAERPVLGPLPHALVSARQDRRGGGRAGPFRNPEQLAYHKPGLPAQVLYKVRFKQGDSVGAAMRGPAGDHLEADIYEHWLEPLK